MPHEKRGPCREIAELERCEAPASRKRGKRKTDCAEQRSGPSFFGTPGASNCAPELKVFVFPEIAKRLSGI
jgi:hypothetical protein